MYNVIGKEMYVTFIEKQLHVANVCRRTNGYFSVSSMAVYNYAECCFIHSETIQFKCQSKTINKD